MIKDIVKMKQNETKVSRIRHGYTNWLVQPCTATSQSIHGHNHIKDLQGQNQMQSIFPNWGKVIK